jgi:hypothetical protein
MSVILTQLPESFAKVCVGQPEADGAHLLEGESTTASSGNAHEL